MIRNIVAVMMCCVCVTAFAQNGETADSLYQKEDWPKVETAYQAILQEQPTNGRAWYRLAVAQRYLEKHEQALASLIKAEEVGVPPSFTNYERAKVHVALKDFDLALETLQQAADAGLSNSGALDSELLDPIKNRAEFQKIAQAVKRNAAPCEVDEHHGDFDFWLGEWVVKDANGTLQGTNKITKAEQGCLVHESWTSAAGNTGQSMNYYNPNSGQWIQRWVSQGAIINLVGGFEDGAMRLEGDIYYYGSKAYSKLRGSWTPLQDGRVRQYFEQYDDEEKEWKTWFEGFYSLKENSE